MEVSHYLLQRQIDLIFVQTRKPLNTSQSIWNKGSVKQCSDAFRDLVLFVQFKKRQKHPWRILLLVKLQAKNIPLWVISTLFKLNK